MAPEKKAPEKKVLKKKFKPWTIISILALLVVIGVVAAESNFQSIVQPQIIVIPVQGEITLYGASSGLLGLSSTAASASDIISIISDANSNPLISAIILEINTNGGTVVASEEISRAVEASKKPVIAWIREEAASGGYFIAASCDKIVADSASVTGSIGVTASYLQYSNLLEKYGVTYERLVTGQYKDTGTPYKELTPEERALMQNKIDTINDMFIAHISKTRKLPEQQVRSLATGEIFLGEEAYNLGLVDILGSEAEAKAAAEKLAGIKNSKLVRSVPQQSLLDQLLKKAFPFSSYDIGRGIGDSLTQVQDFSIRA